MNEKKKKMHLTLSHMRNLLEWLIILASSIFIKMQLVSGSPDADLTSLVLWFTCLPVKG